jgi:hypothetical protein
MGNVWIKEFIGGLDTRRLPETTPGGALILGRDGHITRGGEFEQRADFVKYADLPAGETKGLAATNTGLFVFGHAAGVVVPAGVNYQRLQPPAAQTMTRFLSATLFKGQIFASARYSDGLVYNFFNGTRVTDWPASPFATSVRTVQQKVYGVAGPVLHFSAIADATAFNSGVGHGFIDMSTQATGSEELTALAQYQNFIAVFAGRTIQLEFVDPDPTLNRLVQTLNNTGTIAARSVTQFGDNDVFYLDESGIRSLRARETINVAFSSDTGNPVDDIVVEKLTGLTEDQREQAIGVIEPRDGRLWMAIDDEIFVFSYFTGSKVSAWTTYRPGFTIDDMVVFQRKVYLRSGDTIYVYGGTGDSFVYTNVEAEAWLPYLDADQPARRKTFSGVDVAARGTWEVRAALDPTNLIASDKVGVVTETSYNAHRISMHGQSSHISIRFRCLAPVDANTPAKLGSVVIHHDLDADED